METTHTRQHHPPAASPRLIRCRSGAPSISTPDQNNSSFNTSKRFINRSKSTTRSSTNTKRDEENIDPSTTTSIISRIQKIGRPDLDHQDQSSSNCKNSNGFIRFLKSAGRGSNSRVNSSGRKGVKYSPTKSPSAWALSPGRSSPSLFESPPVSDRETAKTAGGKSGVLKYFKQKKVSAVEEEDYHRFRVLHNRLLQWRFINARNEATMSTINITAQVIFLHFLQYMERFIFVYGNL